MNKFNSFFLLLFVVLSSSVFAETINERLTINGAYNSPQLLISHDGSNGLFLEADGSSTHYNWEIGQQDHVDGGLEFTPSTKRGGRTFTSPVMAMKYNGNVGIGTINPRSKLDVIGTVTIGKGSKGKAPENALLKVQQSHNTEWTAKFSNGGGSGKGILIQGGAASNVSLLEIRDNYDKKRFFVKSNGNVGIGTNSPVSGYKLTVNGGIYALDLRIRPNLNNTADFVFEDNYSLMPLNELQEKIKKDKHLPGIPSAKEMVEEGVSVSEMQAKLLQKIEELTLYMIELKEENDSQEKEIQALKNQISPQNLAVNTIL